MNGKFKEIIFIVHFKIENLVFPKCFGESFSPWENQYLKYRWILLSEDGNK